MTKRGRLLQKLRNVSASGATFSDVVTLLEGYGFRRRRTTGSHWFFVYTDSEGREIHANFAVQNGKLVKPAYVRAICELIGELHQGNED
jgi:predicted RNA binding protein YcfA (HicA-like mRNA interferase family)